jgi:exodeoxyribonuclease VII small subunit
MTGKKLNFDKAFEELQTIVDDIQSDNTSIESLSQKLKRANELVGFCKSKLREIEDEIEEMNNEEDE